jgi:predicted RNA-binding Zn-ribbon protein involved in translation (DUF1610 family)
MGDESEQKCCPEPDCGSIALRRAGVGQSSHRDVDHDYKCQRCGGTFDASEVETTVTTRSGGPKEGTIARDLLDADPEEVGS